jgi:hypothetical protein
VLRSRATAAATSGAASSETYRSAEAQMARATTLEANGRAIDAVRALWQASDLYGRSIAEVRTQPSQLSPAPVPAPPSPPPAVASGRVPESVPAPSVEQPRPQTDIPSGREAAMTTQAAVSAPPPQAPSDADAILETLRRYYNAYESLDVAAVRRVMPSLGQDQVDALRRTFDGMTAYAIDMGTPRIDVQRDTATVRAVVTRRMTPKVGSPIARDVETEFRLRRSGGGWVILDVIAR